MRFELLLEEYQQAASEVSKRLKAQMQLLMLGPTAVFTVSGFAVLRAGAAPDAPLSLATLALTSVLASLLTLLVVVMDRGILQAAGYVAEVLAPKLRKMCRSDDLLGWESYLHRVNYEGSRGWRAANAITAPFPHAFLLLPAWALLVVVAWRIAVVSQVQSSMPLWVSVIVAAIAAVWATAAVALTTSRYRRLRLTGRLGAEFDSESADQRANLTRRRGRALG
jgi:hypothetical protein